MKEGNYMFCEKCGVQLPDGTAFCTQCGADLRASAPAPAAPAPVQAQPAPAPVQTAPAQPFIPQQPVAPAYMPPVAPPPAAYSPAPKTAGTGFRVVNCILAPIALTCAILYYVFAMIDVVEYFSYSSYVFTGVTTVIDLTIMLVCAIMLLAASTKRDYRRGGSVMPLTLFVASTLAFFIVDIARYGTDVLDYYFKARNGLEQTIPFILLIVAMVFWWMLVKKTRSPRPTIWPMWIALGGLTVELVFKGISLFRALDRTANYGLFAYIYYVLFFRVCSFLVIRTALLGKRGVPVAGRPPVGQYVPNYMPPTYQGPYGG